MDAADRPAPPALTTTLTQSPEGFDLHQALRLLSQTGGGGTAPGLRTHLGLGFPQGDMVRADAAGGSPATHDAASAPAVASFGLVGPAGSLPRHVTSRLLSDRRLGEDGLYAFLDLLGGRFLELLQSGWRRGKAAISHEAGSDWPTQALLAVGGLASPGIDGERLRARSGADPEALAYLAALIGAYPRSAENLARCLTVQFGVPVAVEQFHSGWVAVPTAARARLDGASPLGSAPVCGDRRWEAQSRLSIRIGPVSPPALRRLVAGDGPETETHLFRSGRLGDMKQLTRLFLGDGFEVVVRVLVTVEDIGDLRPDAASHGPRLGLDAWLGRPRDAPVVDDPVFIWPA